MKRLVILTEYFEVTLGGISTFTRGLFERIGDRYETTAVTPDVASPRPGVVRVPGAKLGAMAGVFVALCRIRPDVVHVNDQWYLLLPALLYKSLRRRVRVIQTVHLLPVRPLRRWTRYLYAAALGATDRVVGVSRAATEGILRCYGSSRGNTCTIYNGVDCCPTTGSRKRGTGKTRLLTVLNFANEAKTRGAVLLIESIRNIGNVTLTIAGDGRNRELITDAIDRTGQAGKVVMLGHVKNIEEQYRSADVYCHITFQESLGYSILEAMRHGLPLIASNVGGIPEIFDNDPACLTGNDPGEIEDKIRALVGSGVADVDYQRYLQKFSWDTCIESYVRLYESGGGSAG